MSNNTQGRWHLKLVVHINRETKHLKKLSYSLENAGRVRQLGRGCREDPELLDPRRNRAMPSAVPRFTKPLSATGDLTARR